MPFDEDGLEIDTQNWAIANELPAIQPDPDIYRQNYYRPARNLFTYNGLNNPPATVEPIAAPAVVNVYTENQDELISYIEDMMGIDFMLTDKVKKPRAKVVRCHFCGETSKSITIVHTKNLCDKCLERYTKICSGGCEVRLLGNDFIEAYDKNYVFRTTVEDKWGDVMRDGGDPFGIEWYCAKCVSTQEELASLVNKAWACSNCGARYIKCNFAFKDTRGRVRCSACQSDFLVKAQRELAWNANILDFLMPFTPPVSKLQFGIELEVQIPSDKNINTKIAMIRELLPDFVICKHDGSLLKREGWTGFEIVSVPATIEQHKEQWPKLLGTKHGLVSWKTGDCGMHVHITRAALTALQIGRIVKFVNSPDNGALIMMVAGRYSTVYSTILDKKITEACTINRDRYDGTNRLLIGPAPQTGDHNFDRRQAVNLINPNTVEIRIFRGNMKLESFFKNLEFVAALVEFCRNASNSGLNSTEFFRFVDINRRQYPYLTRFFIKNKVLTEIIRSSRIIDTTKPLHDNYKAAIAREMTYTYDNL